MNTNVLESLKASLVQEKSKSPNDIDWDYVILIEKNIARL